MKSTTIAAFAGIALFAAGCGLKVSTWSTTSGGKKKKPIDASGASARPSTSGASARPSTTGATRESDEPEDEQQPSGGDSHVPPRVVIGPGFGPNPRAIYDVRTPIPTIKPSDLGAAGNDCTSIGSTTAKPAIVFELTDDMDGSFAVSASGGFEAMVLFTPGDKVWCGRLRSSVSFGEWPAGEYRLYLTKHIYVPDEDDAGHYTIEFEDTDRDQVYEDGIPTRALGSLDDVLVLDGALRADIGPPNSRARSEYDCNKVQFSAQPNFFIHSARPLEDVELYLAWSPTKLVLRLHGPLHADGSRQTRQGHCEDDNRLAYNKLEGTYAVYVGAAEGTGAVDFSLLVRKSDTEVDRLYQDPNIPDDLPIVQRNVGNHYPYIDTMDDVYRRTYRADETRMGLFRTAPMGLFVFPQFDLDDASAEGRDGMVLPLENEPLLVIDVHSKGKVQVLTADGELFWTWDKYLSPNPDGGAAVPEALRRTEMKLSASLDHAAPADRKAIDAYNDKRAKFDRCYYKVMERYENKVQIEGRGDTYEVSDLADKGDRVARNKCGEKVLEKAESRLASKLAASRTKRRTEALEATRQRFAE